MQNNNADFSYAAFNARNHKYGRIFMAAAICLVLAVPFTISIVLHTLPDFVQVMTSLMALFIFLASGFVEVITYAPLLGTTGTYLAFFTGNLVNLKVPCVVNARDRIGVRYGTAEGEIISAVSVATSTIVTTLVIAFGVLLLRPLTPILENEVLSPAFSMAFTALFGALAYSYFTKAWMLVPLPLFTGIALQVATHLGKSALIPICAVLTVLFAYLLYRREVRLGK